jgi:hypothetical protein
LDGFKGLARCWSFDYFFYNAAKRSLRERFAAYSIPEGERLRGDAMPLASDMGM